MASPCVLMRFCWGTKPYITLRAAILLIITIYYNIFAPAKVECFIFKRLIMLRKYGGEISFPVAGYFEFVCRSIDNYNIINLIDNW